VQHFVNFFDGIVLFLQFSLNFGHAFQRKAVRVALFDIIQRPDSLILRDYGLSETPRAANQAKKKPDS